MTIAATTRMPMTIFAARMRASVSVQSDELLRGLEDHQESADAADDRAEKEAEDTAEGDRNRAAAASPDRAGGGGGAPPRVRHGRQRDHNLPCFPTLGPAGL